MEAPSPPRRSFTRNALWLLVAESVGKVASFVFVVVVARGLGAALGSAGLSIHSVVPLASRHPRTLRFPNTSFEPRPRRLAARDELIDRGEVVREYAGVAGERP